MNQLEDSKKFFLTRDGRNIDFTDKRKDVEISVSAFIGEKDACRNIANYLAENDRLESLVIFINDYDKDIEKLVNYSLNMLISKDGKLVVDPKKIILCMHYVDEYELDFFKFVENLNMSYKNLKNMQLISKKLPNLKNLLVLHEHLLTVDEIGDISNLFEAIKYTDIIEVPILEDSKLQKYIEEHELGDNFICGSYGGQLINVERFGTREYFGELDLSLEDIERLGTENIVNTGCKVNIVIKDAGKLSREDIESLEKKGIKVENVRIINRGNDIHQNEPYNIDEFFQIKEKLEEIVEGINPNLSEEQKFKEVYKRVCESIVYDYEAAYPNTDDEKKYSDEQEYNCRNLKNGLLVGKCVCAGYADILRNALAMVNIDAEFVKGFCVDKVKTKEKYEKKPKIKKFQTIVKNDDGKVYIGEWHAWCKVKIDGNWYNVDPTWDVSNIKHKEAPSHCLMSDDDVKKKDKKLFFDGPECKETMNRKKVQKLFDDKHIYIGDFRIPILKGIKDAIDDISTKVRSKTEQVKDVLNRFFQNMFNKKEKLNEPTDNNEKDESNDEGQPWNLNNWGINTQSFQENTTKVVSNSCKDKSKNDKGGITHDHDGQ